VASEPQYIAIARILRPQGRRGEVLADILTDFPEKFSERKNLWLSTGEASTRREVILDEHWEHKGHIVLKFHGVDSISDAERLAGNLVEIAAADRAELEPGAFYVSDLIGNSLVDIGVTPPRTVGKIEDVQQGIGAAPLLIVRNGKREFEIPFAEAYIVRFDREGRVLEMNLPAGLLEVNAPLSDEEKGLPQENPRDDV
jgi:16S rRNA processing protein RimM